jgi:hypothetical protein
VGKGHLDFPNLDFDTAGVPEAGEYPLADKAYERLVNERAKHGLDEVQPDLRDNILIFFLRGSTPKRTCKDKKDWCTTVDALWTLNKAKLKSPKMD